MLNYIQISFSGKVAESKQASIIGLIYLYYLKDKKYIHLKRINIEYSDYEDNKILIQGDTCDIYKKISSMDKYLQLDDFEKKKYLIDETHHDLVKLFEMCSWKLNDLNSCYKEILDSGYNPLITIFKSKANLSKTLKGEINVIYELAYANVFFFLYSIKGKLLRKIHIIKCYPHPIIYGRILHKCKWVSDREYVLEDMLGEIYFWVDVEVATSTLKLSPKENSVDELLDLVKAIDYRISESERSTLLGIPPI